MRLAEPSPKAAHSTACRASAMSAPTAPAIRPTAATAAARRAAARHAAGEAPGEKSAT